MTDVARRALIVGLDGATLDLVEPWARAGRLPVLAGLMEQGAWARLRSVLPVLSPSAWASFLTGVNPGRHGVYDFIRRAPGGYGLRLTHLGHNRATPFWRALNAQGRRAIVMNVPTTYPPEPLDGVLSSGLGTPDFKPFTYPEALGPELERRGYRADLYLPFRPGVNEAAYLAAQREHTERQVAAVRWLLARETWDVALYVVRGTDEVAHHYWKHMDAGHPAHDPARDGPWRDALLDYYRLCDRLLGELIEMAGPETAVLVVSDHGTGPLYRDVYLNEWLRQAGYLATRAARPAGRRLLARAGLTRARVAGALRAVGLGRAARALKERLGERVAWLPRDRVAELEEAVDWGRSRAYSFGYHGQIYLNVRGREPEGVVAPGAEYLALRAEIMEGLARLVDPADGRPVVSDLFTREELYTGPYVDEAPDIVVIMRDLAYITRHGYEFGAEAGAIFTPPHEGQSGSHRLDGLLIAAGPGLARHRAEQATLSLMDVMPTVLHIIGAAVPSGLDGKIALDWLGEEPRQRSVNYSDAAGGELAGPARDFTEDEEAEVTRRLKDLGYLG
jgi:predicted AlkP superfamily phosphohydrolase/phosphomutase